jgi:hypothetical protein
MLMVSPLDERELARRRAPVSAEKNKTLVRKFFEETWSKGNVAAVDEFTATNYVEHALPSGLLPGPEGLKQLSATTGQPSPT